MKQMRKAILVFFLCITFTASYAQLEEIGKVLAGGKADASMLLTEYIKPYANSLGANLNGGWYNTAKPHKLGGFDLTISASMAFVPSGHRSFDAIDLEYTPTSEYITTSVDGTSSSTVAGKKETGQTITYTYDDGVLPVTELVSYQMPKGTGTSYFLSPMIQASVGLVKETEIIGRFMPQTKLGLKGGTKAGLWGVGIKHSLSQWIPGLKRIPFFNMSLMGGYTRLTLNSGLNFRPETVGWTDATSDAVDFKNQELNMMVEGYTVNLLLSADLPVITIYGGAGISGATTTLMLEGDYPFPDFTADFEVTDNSVMEDPIDIEIKSKGGSTTKPRLNVGFRLKFTVITFHADYTYADYSLITAGLGVALR
jgi:hypothetical protein